MKQQKRVPWHRVSQSTHPAGWGAARVAIGRLAVDAELRAAHCVGMGETPPWRTLTADINGLDQPRLDAWIAEAIDGLSRRRAQQLISSGEVTINGQRARKGQPLKHGDVIEVWAAPAPAAWTALPDPDIGLAVLFQDPHLIAVDKPAGLATVPLAPDEAGTLAGAIAARFGECAPLGRTAGDSGLIQRLDRGTSGIALAARSQAVFDQLIALQEQHKIEKTYVALVRGRAGDLPAEIDAPLAPRGRTGRQVRISPRGSKALTALRPLEQRGDWLLVEAVITRGLRHQIRAHLAHAGLPIAGDELYGGDRAPGLARMFLHAARVDLPHPVTGELLTIASPLPKDVGDYRPSAGGDKRTSLG
jgi:23S rRNA pseudouridine1911/1915/1917 synthase